MAEFQTPPRRAPRKKLKMPLFGNMFGGGGQSATGTKNFGSMLFLIGSIALLLQIYLPQLWAEKLYDDPAEIRDMELNGVIRKKFYDASNKQEVHSLLVLVEKGGVKKKLDLYLADSTFFDQIAVPQRLKKRSGSLDVTIVRYAKPDTTIQLAFKTE